MPADVRTVSAVDPFSVPLRVLHVAQPDGGGVPRYVEEMASHQAGHGWEVSVAAPVQSLDSRVDWHPWIAARAPWDGVRDEMSALAEIVSAVSPQVVVCHSAKAGLVGRVLLRGRIPTVYVPHAWSWLALPWPAVPAAVAWERTAARWTNAVVAVSEVEAATAVRRGVRAPMFVVPNPVPHGWALVTDDVRRQRRTELGLEPGPLAVCVGRICRQKGQDRLVGLWPQVTSAVPGATLVVVGGGPDVNAMRMTAPAGVLLVGEQDPRPWVAAADLAVVPSRWEGLSLAMLEAMATGRSVVTTAVPGSEVVRHARAGAVVPWSEAAFADAIAERLSGRVDAASEGARAAEYAAREHDFDGSAERLAAVILRARAFGRPTRT